MSMGGITPELEGSGIAGPVHPHKEHPNLPLELASLVQIGLREYAGKIPETQSRQGG